jgi:hypothetical protein
MFQFYDDISDRQNVSHMRDREKDEVRDADWSQR